jgi:hypothetical protein
LNFDKLIEYYIILSILHYYFNDKNCLITKVLLIVNRNDIKWYNDITNFKKKPLLYLLVKLKDNLHDSTHVSSHITDSELNNNVCIEIYTLNLNNSKPIILSREDILKLMFDEWVSHI